MMLYLVFFISVLLAPTTATATETFVCIGDIATGFAFDATSRQWEKASFKSNTKYVITKSSSTETVWEVKQVGKNIPTALCDQDFNDTGGLTCRGFEEFRMNKNNLRFVRAYLFGYWTDNAMNRLTGERFAESENTPVIEIGRGSRL